MPLHGDYVIIHTLLSHGVAMGLSVLPLRGDYVFIPSFSYGGATIIPWRCHGLVDVAPSGRVHPKNALKGHKSVSRGQRPREYRHRPREIRVTVDIVRGICEDSHDSPRRGKSMSEAIGQDITFIVFNYR